MGKYKISFALCPFRQLSCLFFWRVWQIIISSLLKLRYSMDIHSHTLTKMKVNASNQLISEDCIPLFIRSFILGGHPSRSVKIKLIESHFYPNGVFIQSRFLSNRIALKHQWKIFWSPKWDPMCWPSGPDIVGFIIKPPAHFIKSLVLGSAWWCPNTAPKFHWNPPPC